MLQGITLNIHHAACVVMKLKDVFYRKDLWEKGLHVLLSFVLDKMKIIVYRSFSDLYFY